MTSVIERLPAMMGEDLYPPDRLREIAETVEKIRDLKAEKDAVVLAHNYQRPEIFEVADFIGDSLELARRATKVEAKIIVFCGVHFMAETAKILNPTRKVLLPNLRAGCTLADSVDPDALAARIRELRKDHPRLGVVCYVNTTAATKALCDATCTSSNAVEVVERLDADPILFLPDKNLAAYVAEHTEKTIIPWEGDCYVHQDIRPEAIEAARAAKPGAKVIAHPECRKDVLAIADAVLSTSGMIRYAKESEADEFIVVTECGLSDRLFLEVPGKKFYKACKLCRFMKMITLEGTLRTLETESPEVEVPEEIRARAERALARMFELCA